MHPAQLSSCVLSSYEASLPPTRMVLEANRSNVPLVIHFSVYRPSTVRVTCKNGFSQWTQKEEDFGFVPWSQSHACRLRCKVTCAGIGKNPDS